MSKWRNGYNDFVNNCEICDDNDFSLISGATSAANKVEMPYDGWLVYATDYNKDRGFSFINADNTTTYAKYFMNSNHQTNVSAAMPFKKGWYFYTTTNNVEQNPSPWDDSRAFLHFYKKRDYSNR